MKNYRSNFLIVKFSMRFFAMVVVTLAGCLLFFFLHPSSANAAYSLPYGAGATPQLGISGLHGGNFSAMQDDSGTYYYFGNNTEPDESLDIGYSVSSGGNAPTSAIALDTGTVIAHNTSCHQIVVSYNSGSIWAMYIHVVPVAGLYDGEAVSSGTVLGTPQATYPCGESGTATFAHVHFAFMTKTDSTHGNFFSMIGQVLCGYNVISNGQVTWNGYSVNLSPLTTLNIPAIPSTCPGNTSASLKVQSGVSVTSPTPPAQIVMNQYMSGSYTVFNNGDSNFNLRSLGLFAKDANGNKFFIDRDNVGSDIYVGAHSPRTFNGATYNFAYNCPSCTNGGSYQIIAEYEDTGVDTTDPNSPYWHQIGVLDGSGASNPLSTTVRGPLGVASTYDPQSGYNILFKTASDGNIYEEDNNPSSGWGGWYLLGNMQHPTNSYFYGTPTVVINGANSNNPVVMAADQNGTTWSTTRNGTWGAWQNQGGNATENIVGTYFPANPMAIFYMVGKDGKVYENDDATSWWGGWQQIGGVANPSGVNFAGTPNVTLDNNGNIVVVVRDTTGHPWVKQMQSFVWQGWQQIGSLWLNTLSDNNVGQVTFPAAGTVMDMAIGTGGQVFENDNHGSSQSGWYQRDTNPTNITFTGTPKVTVSPNGEPEVIVRDTSGNVWYDGMNTSYSWQGWRSESGGTSIMGDTTILNFPSAGNVGLYAIGSDGGVWESDQHLASPYFTASNWWTRS